MNLKYIGSSLLLSTVLLNANYSAGYNGNTGVLETPNARIMNDWSMRMFVNQDAPYTYYGFAGTPLPFLEANFHMTQLDGVYALSDGYGDYKDKSLSIKIQLNKEGKYLPAIVLGADDIWGTALYTSKYLAFSKRISYFDFTLGYAKGRLGGENVKASAGNNSGSLNNEAFNYLKDLDWSGGKPFGSIVFNATPELSLMWEYSPIDYRKDKINPFLNQNKYDYPESKINFGAKYKISDKSTLTLSYNRGNQISFGYSFQFGFSRNGIFTHLPDEKWKASSSKIKEYQNLSEKELSEKLSNEVALEKLSNVKTSVYKNKIWSEIDNPRYNNDIKAVGRAISTIDEVAPKNYDTIYMTLKQRDVPLKTFKVNRAEFDAYENGKVSDKYMKDALLISNSVDDMYDEFSEKKQDIYKTDIYGTKKLTYSIGPAFKTYLNAPTKPLAMKISAMATANYDFGTGLFANAKILHPLYNDVKDMPDSTFEESNKLATRSNMLEYYKYNDTQLEKLTLAHIFKTPFDSISKIEAGYFDLAFAGIDLEWYKSFYNDRFGLGLQYQHVYKRPVDNLFKVDSDLKFDAKFLNVNYLLSPKYDMHLGLKIGQFLGGDKGVKIDFTRHFKNFSIGAFATITDSDKVFTNPENRDYINKGIFMKIPLDVFTYKNVKGHASYDLSPWTRDVGQYADTSFSLHQINNSENNIQIMKKYINKIKE